MKKPAPFRWITPDGSVRLSWDEAASLHSGWIPVYSGPQMDSYGVEQYNEAIEAAAKTVEAHKCVGECKDFGLGPMCGSVDVERIKALKKGSHGN